MERRCVSLSELVLKQISTLVRTPVQQRLLRLASVQLNTSECLPQTGRFLAAVEEKQGASHCEELHVLQGEWTPVDQRVHALMTLFVGATLCSGAEQNQMHTCRYGAWGLMGRDGSHRVTPEGRTADRGQGLEMSTDNHQKSRGIPLVFLSR